MPAIAEAQPNIALIKYWGKRDVAHNLPAVSSLSITLSDLRARTELRTRATLAEDRLTINGERDAAAEQRARLCLEPLRRSAGRDGDRLDIRSEVNFPVAAGLASSAAGYAALVTAANELYQSGLDRQQLARLAGAASGSAARSIFGGFVRLIAPAEAATDIVVESLADAGHWPLNVVIAITDASRKRIGSSEAMMRTAETSAYYGSWVETQDRDIREAVDAVGARDFQKLADVSESSCLKMHGLMLSALPGIIYWKAATVAAIHAVRDLRSQGVPVFFTVDAGPQVKAVCLPGAADQVAAALDAIAGVQKTLITGLGAGARVVS